MTVLSEREHERLEEDGVPIRHLMPLKGRGWMLKSPRLQCRHCRQLVDDARTRAEVAELVPGIHDIRAIADCPCGARTDFRYRITRAGILEGVDAVNGQWVSFGRLSRRPPEQSGRPWWDLYGRIVDVLGERPTRDAR